MLRLLTLMSLVFQYLIQPLLDSSHLLHLLHLLLQELSHEAIEKISDIAGSTGKYSGTVWL
jgi:hypothetical protein